MTKTKAPTKTPSPTDGEAVKLAGSTNKADNPSAVFIGMALDMSWRLAIVVLLPIIGGYELDQHFDLTPLLTIAGFLLAMVGMALVLWQTVQEANRLPVPKAEKKR